MRLSGKPSHFIPPPFSLCCQVCIFREYWSRGKARVWLDRLYIRLSHNSDGIHCRCNILRGHTVYPDVHRVDFDRPVGVVNGNTLGIERVNYNAVRSPGNVGNTVLSVYLKRLSNRVYSYIGSPCAVRHFYVRGNGNNLLLKCGFGNRRLSCVRVCVNNSSTLWRCVYAFTLTVIGRSPLSMNIQDRRTILHNKLVAHCISHIAVHMLYRSVRLTPSERIILVIAYSTQVHIALLEGERASWYIQQTGLLQGSKFRD